VVTPEQFVSYWTIADVIGRAEFFPVMTGVILHVTEKTDTILNIRVDFTDISRCLFKALERKQTLLGLLTDSIANLKSHTASLGIWCG
jgi:hypothetical protein